MPKAHTANGIAIEGMVANNADGPFYCPKCKEEVHLKQGIVRIPHFAHFPESTCTYAGGESQAHLNCKRNIYTVLKRNPACQTVQLEAPVGTRIADVLATIHGTSVAVEVQRSDETIDGVAAKLRDYHNSGVTCIYILPASAPTVQVSLRAWQRYLHAMWYGEFTTGQTTTRSTSCTLAGTRTCRRPAGWKSCISSNGLCIATCAPYLSVPSPACITASRISIRGTSASPVPASGRAGMGKWWTDTDAVYGTMPDTIQPVRVERQNLDPSLGTTFACFCPAQVRCQLPADTCIQTNFRRKTIFFN